MLSKSQKIRLIIFLLICLGLFSSLFFLKLSDFLFRTRDHYSIILNNRSVVGLRKGSAVLYNGISVGRVEQISLVEGNVESIIIEISLDKGTPVKKNTVAVLSPMSFSGFMRINLKGGSNEAETLKPGSQIQSGDSGFNLFSGGGAGLGDRVTNMLSNAEELFSKENMQDIDQLLSNVNLIVGENRPSLEKLMANIALVSREFPDTIKEVNGLLKTANQGIDSKQVQSLLNKLDGMINQLEILLVQVNSLLRDERPSISRSLHLLESTLENFNEFSFQLRQNPSAILRNTRSE